MFNKNNITESKKKLIIFIFLTMITFAVYWQVTGHDFINYDDPVYVTQNSHVQSGLTPSSIRWTLTTIQAQFWHPLTWLSLMSDYQLYGLNAGGYHLTNLILHILNTLLLFWLFCRMTGSLWESAFVAAFFAFHPLRVESVAWIAERKDVLSAFFWMLTLCLYVYYTEKPVIKRYLLVLFSFVLALLSKPMVVTLPLIMILLDYWPLKRFKSQKGNLILWQLREKLPFLFFSAVFSVITLFAQPVMHLKYWPPSLESRISNALVSFAIYLKNIFCPQDLIICYPFADQATFFQLSGAVLLILFISLAVILNIKRFPYLFVGWFWYSVVLLPVIGIIPVGNNAMADRYTYLSSIGISIMLVWGVPLLFKNENLRKKILLPAVLLLLSILSTLAWKQCSYWRDSFSLFSHALQVNKENYQPYINIAVYLVKEGNVHEAINYYNKAIRINPEQADAYNNRGIAYASIKQYKLAIDDYNKAIQLQPNNFDIYKNRAIFYFDQGNKILGCKDAQTACEMGNCSILELAVSNGYCR